MTSLYLGWAPLHYSAWHGDAPVVKYLADHAANVDILNRVGEL